MSILFNMKKILFIILIVLVFIISPKSGIRSLHADTENVFVILIHGEIDRSMVVFVRRSIQKASDQKADILIFDIDTFGGRVDSALQITTLIGSSAPIKTVAHITTGPESTGVSWSAGALIAFSSSRIYMAPGTSIGAATPVLMTQEGPQPASEKAVSAIRAQMAALAEKNGYPTGVAKAMVDVDVELLEVYVDEELLVLTREEFEALERDANKSGKKVEKGKVVSPAGKLLTLTAKEMERYGVSSGTVATQDELMGALGLENPRLVRLDESPADRIVGIITSSGFTGMLILIGIVALLLELSSPGFGVPGTVAVICFAVVFSSYALLGTVGSLELILFVVGVILLILEIFIIPGFGVAGVSGLVLIGASLVLSMQGFVFPSFEWQRDILKRNLLVVSMSLVSSLIIFGIMAYSLPQLRLFSKLMLKTAQSADEGYTVQSREEEKQLLGKQGVAVTTLRPSGKAEIGDEVFYVETEGDFVDSGSTVEVIEVSGNRIVVRRC